MLDPVVVTPRSLSDYRAIIGDERLNEIMELARPLRGARVLHVNATAYGGGVAELLTTLVPLMCDVGVSAEWHVIQGADEFFNVTKAMHNALQGMPLRWTPEMFELWRTYNRGNAQRFDQDWDYVVIHDPQPAGIRSMIEAHTGRAPAGKWIWRCHIDLTDAADDVWSFLRPYVECHDAAIFTMEQYVKNDLRVKVISIVPPAIDPLSTKNAELTEADIAEVLSRYQVDPSRPIITQVSRFDPWKDPLGVIDAYRLVKREVPGLQLLMVASMASDDPEGWLWFESTARRAGEDRDIFLLSNLNGVGNVEVNAFQRRSNVVIQKSLREGFGLVVAEALWKGRPVVGGNVGGIPLQIVDGVTGALVDSVESCAARTLGLLRDSQLADRLGQAGRERVRERFLITRYLRDYLALFNQLNDGTPSPAS
jgi:trehalose synthase